MEGLEVKRKSNAGILKQQEIQHHVGDHVKFDEEIIAEHDNEKLFLDKCGSGQKKIWQSLSYSIKSNQQLTSTKYCLH